MGLPSGYGAFLQHADQEFCVFGEQSWHHYRRDGDCVLHILYGNPDVFFTSPAARNEVKEEALLKGLIAIMIFSIPLWLGICKLLGDALV